MYRRAGSPDPQLVLNGLVVTPPPGTPASLLLWRQLAGGALQAETRQAQQWVYFGRLDGAGGGSGADGDDDGSLAAAIASLTGALPRHNPRILPSLSPGGLGVAHLAWRASHSICRVGHICCTPRASAAEGLTKACFCARSCRGGAGEAGGARGPDD